MAGFGELPKAPHAPAWELATPPPPPANPADVEAGPSHAAAAPVVSLSSYAAGTIAGAAGTLVGHPLDTMKVHAQTNTLSRLSWRSLWRGAATPMATAGAVQCLNLGLFDTYRRLMNRGRGGAEASLPIVAGAAAAAGLSISPITAPLTQVKVVQQLRGGPLMPTAVNLWNEGLLYRGMQATAMLESCRAIYLTTYVAIKRAIAVGTAPPGSDPSDRTVPLWGRVVAGALGNMLCWAVAYPIDVVRTHQLSAPPPATALAPRGLESANTRKGALVAPPKAPGVVACARALVNESGVKRLYRGFGVTMLRAGPVSGVILPFFDLSLDAIRRVTGESDTAAGTAIIASRRAAAAASSIPIAEGAPTTKRGVYDLVIGTARGAVTTGGPSAAEMAAREAAQHAASVPTDIADSFASEARPPEFWRRHKRELYDLVIGKGGGPISSDGESPAEAAAREAALHATSIPKPAIGKDPSKRELYDLVIGSGLGAQSSYGETFTDCTPRDLTIDVAGRWREQVGKGHPALRLRARVDHLTGRVVERTGYLEHLA